MKYFKIRIGYGNGSDKYISIDQTELEVAMYCFIQNAKGVFKNGVCRGQDIISITEDWHKEMGWNESYIMQPEDYADIRKKGIEKKYLGAIGETKERVEYLLRSGKQNLIGKNTNVKTPVQTLT